MCQYFERLKRQFHHPRCQGAWLIAPRDRVLGDPRWRGQGAPQVPGVLSHMPNGSFLEDGVCRRCERHNLYFGAEPLDEEEWICVFCSRKLTIRTMYETLHLARWLPILRPCLHCVGQYLVSSESSLRVRLRRSVLTRILRGCPYRFRPITLELDRKPLARSSQVSVLDRVLDFCEGEVAL